MIIGVEGHLFPRPCLFLHQLSEFTFFSPPAELSGRVAAVEGMPGGEIFAFRESGVGLVTLIHDHKCALNVEVHRMYLEFMGGVGTGGDDGDGGVVVRLYHKITLCR